QERAYFNVRRKSFDLFEPRARIVDRRAGADRPLHREVRDVRHEQRRGIDDGGAVLAFSLDGEAVDDGVEVGGIDGALERLAVGSLVEGTLPQVDLVATPVPADDAMAERLASPAHAGRSLGDFGLPEHEAVETILGNLEEDLVVEAMDGKDAGHGL